MPSWLKIYLLGCIASIAYGVYLHKDRKSIEAAMLGFIITISSLSWVGVVALFVGYNLKRNR
jgi:predicted benzoate:H+ symporter BenE